MSQFPSQGRVAGTQFSYQGKGYVLSGDGDNHYPLGTRNFGNMIQLLTHESQLRLTLETQYGRQVIL